MASIDDFLADKPDGCYIFPGEGLPAVVWNFDGRKLAIMIEYGYNAVHIEFSGKYEEMSVAFPYEYSDVLIPVLEKIINVENSNA